MPVTPGVARVRWLSKEKKCTGSGWKKVPYRLFSLHSERRIEKPMQQWRHWCGKRAKNTGVVTIASHSLSREIYSWLIHCDSGPQGEEYWGGWCINTTLDQNGSIHTQASIGTNIWLINWEGTNFSIYTSSFLWAPVFETVPVWNVITAFESRVFECIQFMFCLYREWCYVCGRSIVIVQLESNIFFSTMKWFCLFVSLLCYVVMGVYWKTFTCLCWNLKEVNTHVYTWHTAQNLRGLKFDWPLRREYYMWI